MSRWFINLFATIGLLCGCVETNAQQPGEPSIEVECHGKLRCGMMAIGGETTGATVTFNKLNWELNLPDEAKKFAQEHQKELVTVKGKLRKVAGTEKKARWIVDVTHIQKQETGLKGDRGTTTICGKLHQQDGALMVTCNDITWPIEVAGDASLKAKADSLKSKTVVIKGNIERVSGTELPAKIKIDAKAIDPAPVTVGSKR